jgi:hypothetical protein
MTELTGSVVGLLPCKYMLEERLIRTKAPVAKKAKKKTAKRRAYTKEDLKTLMAHSNAKTPVDKITELMKRSRPALRQRLPPLAFNSDIEDKPTIRGIVSIASKG